jgi:hypothetical protein
MSVPKFALSVLRWSLFVFASSMAAQNEPAEHKAGSICVLPNSQDPPTRVSPGGEYNPDTLTIRIDKLKRIPWPHRIPVLIDDLDLKERHLVVLTSDGKRIQSFRFNFSKERDAKSCMYFDGYQGVQFGNQKNADWCRVKALACWH